MAFPPPPPPGIPQDGTFNPTLILNYARDNNADAIRYAAKHLGADISFANRIGQTALHIAAVQGSVAAIKALVELGADVNVQNAMQQTPLHFAANANRNRLETIDALLDLGADIYVVDKHGRLPYELVADNDKLRFILGGPDPRLFEAAATGDLNALREIYKEDPETDPDPIGGEGYSPLHLACKNGHLGVASFLLEKAAQLEIDVVNQREVNSGNTAAHLAVLNNHSAIVTLLHRRGASFNEQNFHTSTYAQGGWMRSADGQQLIPMHQTPLHIAVEESNEVIVKMVLEYGANPNIKDFDGRTPLHYALEVQDTDMAVLLLESGADANEGCVDFASPLLVAAQRGDVQMIEALLKHGAEIEKENCQGWTALMLAVRSGRVYGIKALLDAGAGVKKVNPSSGNSILHLAAANGRPEVCKVVLAAEGAAEIKDFKNKEGKTAVELAKNDHIKELFSS